MPVEPKTPTPKGPFWTAAMNTPTTQASAGGPTPAPASSSSTTAAGPQLTQDQFDQFIKMFAKSPVSHHVTTLAAPALVANPTLECGLVVVSANWVNPLPAATAIVNSMETL